ncbi:MAG: diacylglycerol/lipid kinase family protein [Caulobacterales bacterium]
MTPASQRPLENDAAASLSKRVIAVLNTDSASCDATTPVRIGEIFARAGLAHPEVISIGPPNLEKALEDAATKAEVVVVLGGDGTIRTAAMKCGKAGKLLIPLPGGTMNMLSRALYGDVSWEQALTNALAAPDVREVSGGSAEGQPFFCVAILGAPTLWADAREAIRRGRLFEAIKRSLTAIRRSGEALHYQLGDQLSGTAEAVAVICPLVSMAMHKDEHSLEAAALDPTTAGAMFRLASHAIFDNWRDDPSVSRTKVKAVRVSGHGRVPVILDGEKAYMGRTVSVTFVPLAFRAIAAAEPVA